MIAIGLMSGTSLDGIDAALVDLAPRANGYTLHLLNFETYAFEEEVRQALEDSLPPNGGSVAALAALHHALGEALARAAAGVAGGREIAYVASHGQTVWHDGNRHITLQLGDAFVIRERVRATVCFDFRSADCAAGGQGAPLVPHVDALLFGDANEDRLALNLGGIANVSCLPKNQPGDIAGFDTGPGNMLLDLVTRERTGDPKAFDRDGALAARGQVDAELLAAMLTDDFFAQPPPKSTGRERFGAQFLARFAARFARLSTEDALATLAELTAASIESAVRATGFEPSRILVSGGGARNRHLLERIAARFSPSIVETSDAMGIPTDAKEAIAFAVLGYETLRGRAANVPRVTGAVRAVPLGALAPYRLEALLAAVERECRSS